MPRKNRPHDVFRYVDMTGGPEACWPWKRGLHKERPYFEMNGRKYLAYRITYSLTYGKDLEDLPLLRHTCDVPYCCNPAHLVEGDHQANMDDMKMRDRHGIPHHAVRGIRSLLEQGDCTHKEIAERYGVARETVTAIANKRRRGDVE